MSKIISFARTTAAFVAMRKSVTRREWTDEYFMRWKAGDPFQAWSATPRVKGARKVGDGVVLSIVQESTRFMPETDFEAEGFHYMMGHGLNIGKEQTTVDLWKSWREQPVIRTTIRFEIVSIEPGLTPEMFGGLRA